MSWPTTAEMQGRGLPRLKAEDIATPDDTPEADRQMAALDEYLAKFTPTKGKCICCDAMLGGFLGSFGWGIVHGEGSCGGY